MMSTSARTTDQLSIVPRGGPAGGNASHAVGFWSVAVAFATLMAFGTAPTPLWPIYEVRDHFGATTVTVAFAVVVVGAAVGFTTLGHLSDRLGRRRVIAAALVTSILSAVVLAIWPQLPALIIGRLLTGIGIALMASTATAFLSELYHKAHPDHASSPVPALVATAANLGGLALGPLVAGALAQWAGAPLTTSYIVFGALMALLCVFVLAAPETVDSTPAATDRPARFALMPGQGTAFGSAAAVGFFAFAVIGLFSSLGPIIVRGQLGIDSYFIAGLAPFIAFAASAVLQLVLGALTRPALFITGTVLFPAGLALTALALYHPALWLALIAAGLAGGGAGLLFKGAVTQSALSAAPQSRAGVLSIFFVIAYLGMGLPSIAFSIVIQHADIEPSMIGFAALISLGAAVAVAAAIRSFRSAS